MAIKKNLAFPQGSGDQLECVEENKTPRSARAILAQPDCEVKQTEICVCDSICENCAWDIVVKHMCQSNS
jgi:hypothetical protein